jgi:putative transposase
MLVSKSAYYDWAKRPAKLISAATLHLYRRAKALFKASLDSRELAKNCVKKALILDVIVHAQS